jgi:hypothetical protein
MWVSLITPWTFDNPHHSLKLSTTSFMSMLQLTKISTSWRWCWLSPQIHVTQMCCKQDILTLFVFFFPTCKVKKNSFQNFQPSCNISNQMEFLEVFIGTFSLLVTSQKKLYHTISTWKNTPNISLKIMLVFEKYIFKCSPHQYWRLGK